VSAFVGFYDVPLNYLLMSDVLSDLDPSFGVPQGCLNTAPAGPEDSPDIWQNVDAGASDCKCH
jgi:hypothetical protein